MHCDCLTPSVRNFVVVRWEVGEFTDCSATCEGIMSRVVSCRQQQPDGQFVTVADSVCNRDDVRLKPVNLRPCGPDCSTYSWDETEWSPCSVQCGDGTQQRSILCVRTVATSTRRVSDDECRTRLGPKPALERRCDPVPRCMYNLTQWSRCSVSCDFGMRTRVASCIKINTDGSRHIIGIAHCDSDAGLERPITSGECNLGECPCVLPRWVTRPWSSCTRTCGGGGTQQRDTQCHCFLRGQLQQVFDRECAAITMPPSKRNCGESDCPCERHRWRKGPWEGCSVTCDAGIEQRALSCICTQEGEVKVSPVLTRCLAKPQPAAQRDCYGPPCPCENPRWVTGNWTDCSKKCNGKRSRKVTCNCGGVTVEDGICRSLLTNETRPSDGELCGGPCQCENYRYRTSDWSHCSKTCGNGTRTRGVTCWCDIAGRRKYREMEECATSLGGTPPAKMESCQTPCPCVNQLYVIGEWSPCSERCGGTRVRGVACHCSIEGKDVTVQDEECYLLRRPAGIEDCAKCQYTWAAKGWKEVFRFKV